MRIILMFFICLGFCISTTAQDVVIEAKDMGTEVVLMATNNEDADVTVKVELKAVGYDIGESNIVEVSIPKKETIEVGRYKRDKSEKASFQFGYSTTKTTTTKSKKTTQSSSSSAMNNEETINLRASDPQLKDSKGLYVYSINNCSRCRYAVEFLETNNIDFEEKNMDNNDEVNREAFGYLKSAGFQGGSFRTPLIINDGKVSYNIKDLKGFLKDLKGESK